MVYHAQWLGNGFHALLHHAQVLENTCHLPRYPACGRGDLPGQGQGGGKNSDLQPVRAPQDQPHGGRGHQQQGIHHPQSPDELRDQPHMVGHRFLVGLDHVLDVRVLVAGTGEKLDRQDIGVGIDHPRHHPRALLRADFGEVAHARHEVAQKPHIGGKPAHGRNGQPPIGQAHQADGGDAVNHDVPNRPHARDGALAQRIACLHNPVGNAPGKVILEKWPALAHHVPVVLPAHHARKRAHHRVKAQQTVKQQGGRAQHQHENQHGQQHGHGVLQGSIAISGRHQADQFAN